MTTVFGMVMLTSIAIQMFFPVLPLYSIGYMIGSCLLRSFIIGNEKEEYRLNLETALEREKRQSKELKEAWELAYKDALTGAGSKLAYLERIEKIDNQIHDKKLNKLSILVFDINNLKQINDTQGHQAGDKCIIEAYQLIKEVFKENIVYRIGGDEFVIVIEDDYEDRFNLVDIFNEKVEENLKNHKVVISLGLADYNNNTDKGVRRIVERADFLMYERKEYLKAKLI